MARTLTPAAWAAITAQETDEVVVVLLELTHSTLSTPIRVSSDNAELLTSAQVYGTTSNSVEYVFFPFRFIMPDENEDSPPRASLVIDNIDRSIVQAVRNATGDPINVSVKVVLASDPDTLIVGEIVFALKNVHYDATSVSGDLSFAPVLDEPYPEGMFGPSDFPGLF